MDLDSSNTKLIQLEVKKASFLQLISDCCVLVTLILVVIVYLI